MGEQLCYYVMKPRVHRDGNAMITSPPGSVGVTPPAANTAGVTPPAANTADAKSCTHRVPKKRKYDLEAMESSSSHAAAAPVPQLSVVSTLASVSPSVPAFSLATNQNHFAQDAGHGTALAIDLKDWKGYRVLARHGDVYLPGVIKTVTEDGIGVGIQFDGEDSPVNFPGIIKSTDVINDQCPSPSELKLNLRVCAKLSPQDCSFVCGTIVCITKSSTVQCQIKLDDVYREKNQAIRLVARAHIRIFRPPWWEELETTDNQTSFILTQSNAIISDDSMTSQSVAPLDSVIVQSLTPCDTSNLQEYRPIMLAKTMDLVRSKIQKPFPEINDEESSEDELGNFDSSTFSGGRY